MTRKDLEGYKDTCSQIEDLGEEIKRLEARLAGGSPAFDTSGIPRNPVPQNTTEKEYIELISKKAELSELLEKCRVQKKEVEDYIDKIDNYFTKRIFQKRIFEKKRFSRIAIELGGINSTENVRKRFTRYIEKHENLSADSPENVIK